MVRAITSPTDPKQPLSCLRSIGVMGSRNLTKILFASLLMVSGCHQQEAIIQYELLDELSADGIPKGVDEAVDRLRQVIPPQAQASFRRCAQARTTESCRKFGARFELPLLRQISNEWMRPADSPLASTYRKSGTENPEIMASSLVREYLQSLQQND